jgi:hypothetical protein
MQSNCVFSRKRYSTIYSSVYVTQPKLSVWIGQGKKRKKQKNGQKREGNVIDYLDDPIGGGRRPAGRS